MLKVGYNIETRELESPQNLPQIRPAQQQIFDGSIEI